MRKTGLESALIEALKNPEAPTDGLVQVLDTAHLVFLWCKEHGVEPKLPDIVETVELILKVQRENAHDQHQEDKEAQPRVIQPFSRHYRGLLRLSSSQSTGGA
jgi:hypothetical protein